MDVTDDSYEDAYELSDADCDERDGLAQDQYRARCQAKCQVRMSEVDAYGLSDTDYDEPDGPEQHQDQCEDQDQAQCQVRTSRSEQSDFDGIDVGLDEMLSNLTHARLDEDSSTDLDDSLNTVVEKSLDCAAHDLRNDASLDETLDDSVHGALDDSLDEALDEALADSVHEALDDSVHEALAESVHEALDESEHEALDESVHEALDESVHEALDESVHEALDESDDVADASRGSTVGESQDGAAEGTLDQGQDQDQGQEQEQDDAHGDANEKDAETGEVHEEAQEERAEHMAAPESSDGQLAYMRYLEQVVRSTRRWGILLSKRGLLKMVLRAEFATDARAFEAIFAARTMSLEQTEDYVEFRQGRFVESVKGFDVFALEGGQVDEYMVQGPANRAAFTLFQELVDDLVRKNVYFRFGADSTCDQCAAARSPSSSPSSSLSCSPSSSPSSSDSE
jgi:hypothetical protein